MGSASSPALRSRHAGDGNPLTSFSKNYSFDAEDRATSLNVSNFTSTYDGDGIRAVESDNQSGTVYFVNGLDGHPVVKEKMVSGTPQIIWVHAAGADGEREGYDTGGGQYHAYSYDPEGNLQARSNGNQRYVSVK